MTSSKQTAATQDPQDALRQMMDDAPDGLPSREELDKLVGGERSWAEILGLSAQEAYAFADVAWQLLEQGRLGEAEKVLGGLLVANPWDANLHTLNGCVLARQGKSADALRELGLAVDLDAKNLNARVNRAELYLRSGKVKQAAADLKQVVTLDPKGEKPAGVRARQLARAAARLLDETMKQVKLNRH
ncbi:MAG: hypothetical protein IT382_24975 [Deltaproteobacteria bacterium]|nr:hypothetical protein [Deltaproteobacteria bacterium]